MVDTREFNKQGYLLWLKFLKKGFKRKTQDTAKKSTPKKKHKDLKKSITGESTLTNRRKGTIIHKLKGDYEPSQTVTRLLRPADQLNLYKHYVNLENHKLTALIPNIELYKILPSGRYQPFVFSTAAKNVDKTTIDVLNRSTVQGVGLKSFDMKFTGQTPFTADKIIECNLGLYTDNVSNLFIAPTSNSAKPVDLFTISKPDPSRMRQGNKKEASSAQVRNPSVNEIVLRFGSSVAEPDSAFDATSIFTQKEKETISNNVLTLRMNYNNHNITINQDGSANIDISFNARVDAAMDDDYYDLLGADVDIVDLTQYRKKLDRLKPWNPSKAKAKARKRKMAESVRKEIRRSITIAFREIFESMEKAGDIYDIEISSSDVTDYMLYGTKGENPTLAAAKEAKSAKDKERQDAARLLADTAKQMGDANNNIAKQGLVAMSDRLKKQPDDRKDALEALKRAMGKNSAVSYFFFGDLLEATSKYLLTRLNYSIRNLKEKEKTAKPEIKKSIPTRMRILAEAKSRLSTFRVVLSDMNVKLGDYDQARINIADIPISTDTWSSFYFSEIHQKRRTSFGLKSFLDSCMNKLIPRALAAGGGPKGHPWMSNQTVLRSTVMTGANLKPGSDNVMDIKSMPKFFSNKIQKLRAEQTDYYIAYHDIDKDSEINLKGHPATDNSQGVFHFYLGQNKGLLKRIDFTMYDVPFRKESLMLETANIYSQLKMPYTAKISMYGNNIFYPGTLIYINPNSIGFGDPRDYKSAASRLGFGGYYQIISVTTSWSSDGTFETTLQTGHNIAFSSANTATGGTTQSESQAVELGKYRTPDKDQKDKDLPESEPRPVFESLPSSGRYNAIMMSQKLDIVQKEGIIKNHRTTANLSRSDTPERDVLNRHLPEGVTRVVSPSGQSGYDIIYYVEKNYSVINKRVEIVFHSSGGTTVRIKEGAS